MMHIKLEQYYPALSMIDIWESKGDQFATGI